MTTYINATCKEFWQYQNINISFKEEEIIKYTNEKWYINLVLQKRKTPWKFWETHNLILNEYKPWQKETRQAEISDDDIPF